MTIRVGVYFLILSLTVLLGKAVAGELTFLRPSDYRSYFYDMIEYRGLEVVDLAGDWYYTLEKSGLQNTVELPASWENYQGKITFRRNFRFDDSHKGKDVRLIIMGLFRRCSVTLNDNSLGEYEGPTVDLVLPHKSVHYQGINVLEIKVDNTLHPLKTIPLRSGSLMPENYGGITGDIFLMIEESPSIHEVRVHSTLSTDGETGSVAVDFSIGRFQTQVISVKAVGEIVDSAGKVVARSLQEITDSDSIRLRMEVSKPRLWSLKKTNLYTAEVWLETEEGKSSVHRRRIGFRNFQAGGTFRLNGRELKVRGVTYWAEHKYGCTFKAEDYRRDLMMIRECGANAVLLPEPGHPYLLSLCDSLGILVFQSTSLNGVPKAVFRSKGFAEKAGEHLRRMIYNRSCYPSVIAWIMGRGLADDFPVEGLVDFVPIQDSRLVFWEQGGGLERTLRLADAEGSIDELQVVSALDAGVFGKGEDIEQRQFVEFSRILTKWKNANGLFVQAFADFKADREMLFQVNSLDRRIFQGGLVGRNRTQKLIFNRLHEGWFNLQPGSPITQSDMQPLAFPFAALALLAVLIISIRNNKLFRMQLKRVFTHSHGFFVDVRNGRYIQSSQTMLVGFTSALILSLIFSALFHHYRRSQALDYLLGHLFQGGMLHSAALTAIWSPVRSIVYLFIIIILLYLVTALMFKIASFLIGRGSTFKQCMIFILWSGANFILLCLLPLFFYQGLSAGIVKQLELLVLVFFSVWGYLRVVNALRIACSCGLLKALVIFGSVNLAVLGLVLVYFQCRCGLYHYWGYFFGVVL